MFIYIVIFLADELVVSQRQLKLMVKLLIRFEGSVGAAVSMLWGHRTAIAIHARLLAITI